LRSPLLARRNRLADRVACFGLARMPFRIGMPAHSLSPDVSPVVGGAM